MYGVSSILTLEGVALISFMKLPHDLGLLNDIFGGVSKEGVSIDMVSQTSPLSGNISVSFSFQEDDMVKVLTVVNMLKEKHPDMKPVVSSGNTKLTLSGEEMRTTPRFRKGNQQPCENFGGASRGHDLRNRGQPADSVGPRRRREGSARKRVRVKLKRQSNGWLTSYKKL